MKAQHSKTRQQINDKLITTNKGVVTALQPAQAEQVRRPEWSQVLTAQGVCFA